MSAENNNVMTTITKNPLVSLMVVVVIVSGIIILIKMKGNSNTPKPTTNTTTKEEFSIENFQQSTPMNVMYSDAAGNLGTTTNLGLQNLTVSSDSQFNGNTNTNGVVTGGRIVGKMGDNWGMLWGDHCALIGKKGNAMRFGFADNIGASGWDEKVRIEPDGRLKIGGVYLSDAGDGTLRISNGNGYVDVGAKNGGWGHIYTDRPKFAFNVPLTAVQQEPYKDYAVYTSETSRKVQDSGNALMPSGMIMMWAGAVSNIPAGWVLCDGGNGTPNLRGLFVVGAGPGSYPVGEKGGANEVQLFKRHMPRHNHKSANTSNKIAGQGWPTRVAGGNQNSIDTNGVVTSFNDLISEEGEDVPHENRPPFYALCYIMKV
jgi:microcystin-dependent protein